MENSGCIVDVSREMHGWSDEQVLSTAVKYGEEARRWRNRFLGLLPEVQRRKLYERHGCSSVVEFAKKVGGVSEDQVHAALRLDREFQETPLLHNLFTTGEVGMHKLARVASVANRDNEEFLANQVQLLSTSTINTLVKDIKQKEAISLYVQKSPLPTVPETAQVAVQLDSEVANELIDLRNKGIDIDAELKEFLQQRKEKIDREKEVIMKRECDQKNKQESRYIPARIRKVLKREYGNRCSVTGCKKPSQQIHHMRRYSVDPSHDPKYLAPLCKEHHEMAHTVDVRVQRVRDRKRK